MHAPSKIIWNPPEPANPLGCLLPSALRRTPLHGHRSGTGGPGRAHVPAELRFGAVPAGLDGRPLASPGPAFPLRPRRAPGRSVAAAAGAPRPGRRARTASRCPDLAENGGAHRCTSDLKEPLRLRAHGPGPAVTAVAGGPRGARKLPRTRRTCGFRGASKRWTASDAPWHVGLAAGPGRGAGPRHRTEPRQAAARGPRPYAWNRTAPPRTALEESGTRLAPGAQGTPGATTGPTGTPAPS